MGEVVSLQEQRPHMTGEVKCMNCKHTWVAVAEQGTPLLECPECNCLKGVWINACLAEKPLWTCKCDNEFFVVHIDRIMCANCGEPQHGMWD